MVGTDACNGAPYGTNMNERRASACDDDKDDDADAFKDEDEEATPRTPRRREQEQESQEETGLRETGTVTTVLRISNDVDISPKILK
mmetsp:Transcript_10286/g.26116  ORF Transcript_10286/g.26116 Transcript_10286/m.26116 type:complete len:87 (+) Transcript_10286:961-1221(+)